MDYQREINAIVNELREAICDKANTKMCLQDKCPKLYRCPLGEPTIDNLDALAKHIYEERRKK